MIGPESDAFETVVGLEIHVQLQTASKMFCACPNEFGGAPNSRTCPVCLGLPGALPVINEAALRHAIRVGLALGCMINPTSVFARKNYFYPDLPKGYQISQYDQPLAEDGGLEFEAEDGRRSLGIVRVHLEEDAGKSVHEGLSRSAERTYIDLNRCGVPLVEIVTRPELRSPEQADAFLKTLRSVVLYLGVSDANMEEGSLRCDANVSVRRRGDELSPKTEIKNLNSFRFLRRALRYEVSRQTELLRAGGSLVQGTRLWDEAGGKTLVMRQKEEAHDYRYFPEPDLVPVVLSDETIRQHAAGLPELPLARRDRFVEEYGLTASDAGVLVEDRERAEYFEQVVSQEGVDPVEASNWVRIQVQRWLNEHDSGFAEFRVTPEMLAGLLRAAAAGTVSASTASEVLVTMAQTGREAAEIIKAAGLQQISDSGELDRIVAEVLAAHPDEVDAYRGGRQQVIGYLMGQIMKATGGKADPKTARQLLGSRLEDD